MNNPYGLSQETLDYLRETNPMGYEQFTRPAPTLRYWQAPTVEKMRDLYQTVIAVIQTTPAAPDDDMIDDDIIEGEWRNV